MRTSRVLSLVIAWLLAVVAVAGLSWWTMAFAARRIGVLAEADRPSVPVPGLGDRITSASGSTPPAAAAGDQPSGRRQPGAAAPSGTSSSSHPPSSSQAPAVELPAGDLAEAAGQALGSGAAALPDAEPPADAGTSADNERTSQDSESSMSSREGEADRAQPHGVGPTASTVPPAPVGQHAADGPTTPSTTTPPGSSRVVPAPPRPAAAAPERAESTPSSSSPSSSDSLRTGTFTDASGQILLTCSPTAISDWRVLPAVGWSAQAGTIGSRLLGVRFGRDSAVVTVIARCADGEPRFERVASAAPRLAPRNEPVASTTTPSSEGDG